MIPTSKVFGGLTSLCLLTLPYGALGHDVPWFGCELIFVGTLGMETLPFDAWINAHSEPLCSYWLHGDTINPRSLGLDRGTS